MRFGNTPYLFRRCIFSGLVLGVVGCLVIIPLMIYEGVPLERFLPFDFLFILLTPALVLGVIMLPTVIFSIHINEEWVEHRAFDRWVLSRGRIEDFLSMESPAGVFAAKLRFSDRTTIRFFGAHFGEMAALEKELEKRKRAAEERNEVKQRSSARYVSGIPETVKKYLK